MIKQASTQCFFKKQTRQYCRANSARGRPSVSCTHNINSMKDTCDAIIVYSISLEEMNDVLVVKVTKSSEQYQLSSIKKCKCFTSLCFSPAFSIHSFTWPHILLSCRAIQLLPFVSSSVILLIEFIFPRLRLALENLFE